MYLVALTRELEHAVSLEVNVTAHKICRDET
jgi:hypothetical protein